MHAHTAQTSCSGHAKANDLARHERRTRYVVVLTLVMMVVELVVGNVTGSLALTADGWHMATHAGALGLSAFAYWFARTRAKHGAFTFGTGKVYALSGYTSAVALGIAALWMFVEAAQRLVNPVPIRFAEALPVAVIGLLVNAASMLLLGGGGLHAHDREHDHGHHHGAHAHDHNLRAAYFHVLADAVTSVLAIGALLAGRFLGWSFLDPVMGLVGGAIILHWAAKLCGDAARSLLDASASGDAERALRAQLEAIDDVSVADLHLWELGPGRRGCIVSLVSSAPRETAFYRQVILQELPLSHLTVEVHAATDTPRFACPAREDA